MVLPVLLALLAAPEAAVHAPPEEPASDVTSAEPTPEEPTPGELTPEEPTPPEEPTSPETAPEEPAEPTPEETPTAPAPDEPSSSTSVPAGAGAAAPPAAAPAYQSPPAWAKTDSTVWNAKLGDESEASKSTYKIGKGWTLATHDGRFSMQLRGRIQFRYDLEHPNRPMTDTQSSLQIRRARLVLMGNVFSPHVKYHFQFGFSPRDMQNDLPNEPGSIRRNPLRDARLEFDRLRDFTVWAGQMKVPFSRQRVISSAYMNMVDRSIVNAELNLDRDIGVMALSKDLGGLGGHLAYYAGVFMGEGRNAFELTDHGLLYTGRIEVLPFGKFDDYTEGDIGRSKTPGMSIGAAYAYQDRAHAARGNVGDLPADRGTTNFHHSTADILFKWHGVSFESAVHLRKGFDRRSGGALDDMGVAIPTAAARQGLGWFAQLGWVVPKIPIEVVGRYGLIRDAFGTSSLPDSDEAGGGINWYFVGHDLKLQLDYFRLWDESMGTSPADAARHGTDRIRLQVQLYF